MSRLRSDGESLQKVHLKDGASGCPAGDGLIPPPEEVAVNPDGSTPVSLSALGEPCYGVRLCERAVMAARPPASSLMQQSTNGTDHPVELCRTGPGHQAPLSSPPGSKDPRCPTPSMCDWLSTMCEMIRVDRCDPREATDHVKEHGDAHDIREATDRGEGRDDARNVERKATGHVERRDDAMRATLEATDHVEEHGDAQRRREATGRVERRGDASEDLTGNVDPMRISGKPAIERGVDGTSAVKRRCCCIVICMCRLEPDTAGRSVEANLGGADEEERRKREQDAILLHRTAWWIAKILWIFLDRMARSRRAMTGLLQNISKQREKRECSRSLWVSPNAGRPGRVWQRKVWRQPAGKLRRQAQKELLGQTPRRSGTMARRSRARRL